MNLKSNLTWKLGIVTALLVGYVGFSSYTVLAWFTEQKTVPNNTFATGTLDLTLNPDETNIIVEFADMAPDDEIAGAVEVINSGSLDLRYSLTSFTVIPGGGDPGSQALAAQLELTVREEGLLTDCTPNSVGLPILYGPNVLGSAGGSALYGNPAPGTQGGEQVILAGAKQVLCFQVWLPDTTTSVFEGLTIEAQFQFDAEQTKNLP